MTQAQRLPQTVVIDPKRAGLSGHPTWARHEASTVRSPKQLAADEKARAKELGYKTLNDYRLNLIARDVYGASLPVVETSQGASSQPDLRHGEAGPLAPTWPKPRFPERAYAEGRGEKISKARKELWEEYPDKLKAIDDELEFGAGPNWASECWLEFYEARLSTLRSETQEAKVKAEKEAALSKELAQPAPLTLEALLIEHSDQKIRQWFSREEVEQELTQWGELSKESPELLLADWHRFENSLLYKIKAAELERAKIEGGVCKSFGSSGSLRQVEGFNQKGAAVKQALVEARHKEEDTERVAFRESRLKKLVGTPIVTEQQMVGAATVLLRFEGDPRTHRQYHDRDWREAAGSAAKRLNSSTMMSQSALETEGGATRPDRKALERAFKDDSS